MRVSDSIFAHHTNFVAVTACSSTFVCITEFDTCIPDNSKSKSLAEQIEARCYWQCSCHTYCPVNYLYRVMSRKCAASLSNFGYVCEWRRQIPSAAPWIARQNRRVTRRSFPIEFRLTGSNLERHPSWKTFMEISEGNVTLAAVVNI